MCNNLHINVVVQSRLINHLAIKKVSKPQSYLRASLIYWKTYWFLHLVTLTTTKIETVSVCTLLYSTQLRPGNESTCHVTRSCEKSREIFANNNWQIVRSTKGYEQHSLCQPPDPQYYEFTLVIRQPTISQVFTTQKASFYNISTNLNFRAKNHDLKLCMMILILQNGFEFSRQKSWFETLYDDLDLAKMIWIFAPKIIIWNFICWSRFGKKIRIFAPKIMIW